MSRRRWAPAVRRRWRDGAVGLAALHVHTTFSDGSATVAETLAAAEARRLDVVGFTDHDDVRAFAVAQRWKEQHPAARVEPLWGVELTCFPFRHLLLYKLDPPYPARPPRRFQSVQSVLQLARREGLLVVAPHVATPWVGLGSRWLARLADQIDGYELLTPVEGTGWRQRRLRARAPSAPLALGGSDAHHLAELCRVLIVFPGHGLAGFRTALRARAAHPIWADPPAPIPPGQHIRRHLRALVTLPVEQAARSLCRW